MPAVIPALIGAASSIGGALATAAPVVGAVGSIAGPMMMAGAARDQAGAQVESARIAAAGRGASTPGGALIQSPTMNQPGAAPGGTQRDDYAGGGSRYNSAQRLATSPSLTGTGSGFNGASQFGQPQPGETGVA